MLLVVLWIAEILGKAKLGTTKQLHLIYNSQEQVSDKLKL